MTILVQDLMHKGLMTCQTDAPLGLVASLLAEYHIHALVVTDQTGRPAGIISDFDLLAGEWLSTDRESLAVMKNLTAGEMMSTPIDTVEADMPLIEAVRILLDKQIHRLMVTQRGSPVGVLSVSDVIASFTGKIRAKRDTVGDVMSDAFLVCRDQTPIVSAARTMTQTHWRSVIVVDARGVLQGVVTSRDLLQFAGNGFDESLTVRDVMHTTLTTIDIAASLQEAANLMIHKHQHRLIVTDRNEPDGFPLGIITSFDIVAEMARPGSVWQA
jgi:predicted transcriptional regulator